MKTTIILVAHGVPPTDFPREETGEFFGISSRIRRAGPEEAKTLRERQRVLEEKMRNWPRTPENDPFYFATRELADRLAAGLGLDVGLAFNEFCAPDIETALDDAVAAGAGKVIVATTMMTRGGGHSESEIKAAIDAAGKRHPDADIIYAWPYETDEVASFLASHVRRFL